MWRTTCRPTELKQTLDISIHVPRVEDDDGFVRENLPLGEFQSTSPVWRTTILYVRLLTISGFQSTSPVWRTTIDTKVKSTKKNKFQSTSPVWRTTRGCRKQHCDANISIHVPRVEDDMRRNRKSEILSAFQSTSPVWRTTRKRGISRVKGRYFNPRPPCGGRLTSAA